MLKLISLFVAVTLAVGNAQDEAIIIGETLPNGEQFEGLGFDWNTGQTIQTTFSPKNKGWGNPGYSNYNGGGWPSTPVYKEIPVIYNSGWGQRPPKVYNSEWGLVRVTHHAGWKKVPIVRNSGWGSAPRNSERNPPAVVPLHGYAEYARGNGWGGAAVPVLRVKSVSVVQSIPVHSLAEGNGWSDHRYG